MRKIYQFQGSVRMVEGRHGNAIYNQNCKYIGKALELYGEYCEHEISFFKKIIRPDSIVWEVGSNTGAQSVALAKMVPKGKFIGFEPQVELFKIFAANLAINNCENAVPMNYALGKEDGVIDIPLVDYHQSGNFGAVSFINNSVASNIKVEVRKIDSLSWLPSPDFIKIDVEGMECLVLEGGRGTILGNKPFIYIENDRVEKSEELIQRLWDFGYDVYWHISGYYSADNYFVNPVNIYANQASFNMFCVSKGAIVNIKGLTKVIDKNVHPIKPVS